MPSLPLYACINILVCWCVDMFAYTSIPTVIISANYILIYFDCLSLSLRSARCGQHCCIFFFFYPNIPSPLSIFFPLVYIPYSYWCYCYYSCYFNHLRFPLLSLFPSHFLFRSPSLFSSSISL